MKYFGQAPYSSVQFWEFKKQLKAEKRCFKYLRTKIRKGGMIDRMVEPANSLQLPEIKITVKYCHINEQQFCITIIIIQYIFQSSFPMNAQIFFQAPFAFDYHVKSQVASSDSKDSKDNYQIDFVSQFLELNQHSEPSPTEQKDKNDQDGMNLAMKPQIGDQEMQNLQNLSETKNKRSLYHNFQKHLITTLKINILLPKITSKSDMAAMLASKMWKIFQQSNYFSKKILHFLFGVASSSRPNKKAEDVNKIYPGFQQIVKNYEAKAVERAQQFLRQEVYDQGRRLLSENVFSGRRMQKSEEFQQYFAKFLEEIQHGAISKRLPKYSKIRSYDNVTKIGEDSA